MNAVDTNVLVRILTADDRKQTSLAKALFEAEPVWIAKTVLLEAEWVLRTGYGFTVAATSSAFTDLLGLPNVHAEDESSVVAALALSNSGLDFADALHLCSRPPNANFLTFDRKCVRKAKRAGVSKISAIGNA